MSSSEHIPVGEHDTSMTSRGPRIQDRFGKYAVVGPLARGGMAELTLALQEGEGIDGVTKVVALKRVLPSAAEQPAFIQMFLDEARLAARLDHPNIVRMYDVGNADGRYFLAMEFLPAEDLHRVMAVNESIGQPIDPLYAAAIISAAAEGLHFAHELTDENGAPLGLVHRDISPSNILMTYYGHVKIVDFGIAKAASNTFRTEAGIMKGKAAYFAPEQISHGPLDRRCDVYSMGIVLWELLAGRRLFQRETHAATLASAAVAEIPDITDLRPDVDDELRAIVMTALERSPTSRYQTAGELHDALEEYLRQHQRPTVRELASWLESLFGQRRAAVKIALARGINLNASLDEMRDLDEALAREITSQPGVGSANISSQLRASAKRPKWHGMLVAACTVVAAALVIAMDIKASRPVASVLAIDSGRLKITSTPTGASVFLNGEPTGKVTPAEIGGLKPGSPLDVRVQLAQHRGASESVTPSADAVVERTFTLNPEPQ